MEPATSVRLQLDSFRLNGARDPVRSRVAWIHGVRHSTKRRASRQQVGLWRGVRLQGGSQRDPMDSEVGRW